VALTGEIDPAFWRGRRVLVTGHTGFKGAWLTLWLHTLGADVTASRCRR
jgi:CDP-glucose 4,6-dehydratase